MAEFDVATNSWSTRSTPHLYLYGAANGVVLDMIVDETTPYDLYVVGAFDTTCKVSQVQYCNVGLWHKSTFLQVGDSLCSNSGGGTTASAMQPTKVITAAVGDRGNLFIGGTFQFRVWTGVKFENVYNVAQFVPSKQAWLPLAWEGGGLTCNWCTTSVMTMAWDAKRHTLYMGGKFNSINFGSIPAGIASYSNKTGLQGFLGGGLSMDNMTMNSDGVVTALAFDNDYNALFVAGVFSFLNNIPCASLARWRFDTEEWTCLHQEEFGFDLITSLLFMNEYLYVAGMPSLSSTWKNLQVPHTIARVNETAVEVTLSSMKAYKTPDPTLTPASSTLAHNNGHRKRRLQLQGAERDRLEHSLQQIGLTLEPTEPLELRGLDDPPFQPAMSYNNNLRGGSASPNPFQQLEEQVQLQRNQELQHQHQNQTRRKRWLKDQRSTGKTGSAGGSSENQLDQQSQSHSMNGSAIQNIIIQYFHHWEWLPYFGGTNDVITRLTPGFGNWSNGLFIAGVFTNMDPIFMWDLGEPASKRSPFVPPSPRSLGRQGEIQGAVLSVVSMEIVADDMEPLSPNANKSTSWSWQLELFILFSFAGLIFGVLIVLLCFKHWAYIFFETTPSDSGRRQSVPLKEAHRLSPILSSSSATLISPVTKGIFDKKPNVPYNEENSWAEILREQLKTVEKQDQLHVIDPAKIMLHTIIGQGTFGRVWSGVWGSSQVAVKEFEMAQEAVVEGSIMKDFLVADTIGEAAIMSVLRHPKILRLFGCSLTSKAIWIVSELCDCGNLRQLLDNRKKRLSTRRRLKLALDITEGMLYLHTSDPPIIHRDLKSHNVFVSEVNKKKSGKAGDYIAKIGDLGSARARHPDHRNKTMTWRVGSACWLSPEVIDQAHYSEKSDVYAFGMVLWEIATRDPLYQGLTEQQILFKVSAEGLRPPPVEGCPWNQIMQLCWNQNPDHRPTFRYLMNYFQDLVLHYSNKGYNRSPTSDRKSVRRYRNSPPTPATPGGRKSFQQRSPSPFPPSQTIPRLSFPENSFSLDADGQMNGIGDPLQQDRDSLSYTAAILSRERRSSASASPVSEKESLSIISVKNSNPLLSSSLQKDEVPAENQGALSPAPLAEDQFITANSIVTNGPATVENPLVSGKQNKGSATKDSMVAPPLEEEDCLPQLDAYLSN
eukprot:CAMPEP_0117860422 /NCGR_PEP_ID=MMETSP0950-20121206/3761_1 /TAXON_ID=44440 /ORGANISM="Chattonella subsalsa, Strain CCMP2191" /LENGTH=1162 /DNA_ID=CAMNT_0005710567 /DNA_START=381 /DNA_END=3869 /DNA_ORIENTATION=+